MTYHIFIYEKKLSAQAEAAISEYKKRLSPFCNVIVSTAKESALSVQKFKNEDFQSTPSGLPSSVFLCPDLSGTNTVSSEAFAKILAKQAESGCAEFRCFIGFPVPNGALSACRFSISGMSLSNEIAAIAFVEQLYRGYTINRHIPYHK